MVPLAVILLVGLLVGDEDFEIDLGALGKYSRRRAGEKAAAELGERQPELDRRGDEFLQTLEGVERS